MPFDEGRKDMWFAVLFTCICAWIGVYVFNAMMIKTKAVKKLNYVRKKFVMKADPDCIAMADEIEERVLDLNGQFVQILRRDEKFCLVFIGGSVYFEKSRWEIAGNAFRNKKDIKCILNRTDWGKKPLTRESNRIFAEIVLYNLSKCPWLTITKNRKSTDVEISISKSSYFVVPEKV